MNIFLQKKPKRINVVSVTLTTILVVGGYFLWFWVPAFWPIFQLSGIMRGACNDAYRQTDDAKVVQKLLADAKRTRLKLSEDNFRFYRVPYTDEELEKLPGGRASDVWARKGKICVIEMHYEDDYRLPLIDKTHHQVFERTVEVKMTPVTWEKQDWSLPECRCVHVPGSALSDVSKSSAQSVDTDRDR